MDASVRLPFQALGEEVLRVHLELARSLVQVLQKDLYIYDGTDFFAGAKEKTANVGGKTLRYLEAQGRCAFLSMSAARVVKSSGDFVLMHADRKGLKSDSVGVFISPKAGSN